MSIAKSKYRSLFSDVVGPVRRSSRGQATAARHAPLRKPSAVADTHPAFASSPLDPARTTGPPAYQPPNQRSRKTLKVYPKPEGDQVLSVTIRLRGDCDGEILTTTATFQYDPLSQSPSSILITN